MAEHKHYGLIAEFSDAEKLIAVAKEAHRLGYRRINANSPFPLEPIQEIFEQGSSRAYGFGVAGAIFGALLGLGMQIYANLSYPIRVGGLPLIALQSFATVTFLLMIGFAALFALLGLLWLCQLPLLSHPLHEVQVFGRATDDRFLLFIGADDPLFDLAGTALWLADRAISVSEVPT